MMERLWFKAKTYGWGLTPACWQGWLVILLYVAAIAASAFYFLRTSIGTGRWIGYFTSIAIATAAFLVICFKTGEKPRWRWGEKSGPR